MYILVTIFHVIACVVLICVILLQSGRGGGLSEMLGGAGGQSQKLFGTQTSDFLTKGTTYCAVIFVITSITLGILTSHRSQSVLESAKIKPLFSQNSTTDLDTLKAQVAKQLDEAKSKMDAESNTAADKVSADAEAMSEAVSAGATAAE